MGLDSVELVLGWEDAFGISISDAEAQAMFSTRQAIEKIFEKVKTDLPEDVGSLSMRAFFRLRKAFQDAGVSRCDIRLDAKVSALFPNRHRRDILCTTMECAGLHPLTKLPFGLQFTVGCVRDIVTDPVINQHETLRLPGHGWSKTQVREVVRAVMLVQLAIRNFSDDAKFVKDLGIC
jgi:hypothetical protein